jgi:hypothetical protein
MSNVLGIYSQASYYRAKQKKKGLISWTKKNKDVNTVQCNRVNQVSGKQLRKADRLNFFKVSINCSYEKERRQMN